MFAQLGERVKKGEPLAVIESPDIGTATSDVGKAKADLDRRRARLQAPEGAARGARGVAEATSRRPRTTTARRRPSSSARSRRPRSSAQRRRRRRRRYTLPRRSTARSSCKAISPGVEVQGQYGGGTAVELFTIGELDRGVGPRRRLRDGHRAREGRREGRRQGRRRTRDEVFDGQGRLGQRRARPGHAHAPRCAARSTTPTAPLKPEMYATVRISVDEKKALAIPRDAVLRLGDQTVGLRRERARRPTGKRALRAASRSIVDEGEGEQVAPGRRTALDAAATSGRRPRARILSGMLVRGVAGRDPMIEQTRRVRAADAGRRRPRSRSCSSSARARTRTASSTSRRTRTRCRRWSRSSRSPTGWSAEEVERYVTIPLEIGLVRHAGPRPHPLAVALRPDAT